MRLLDGVRFLPVPSILMMFFGMQYTYIVFYNNETLSQFKQIILNAALSSCCILFK